MRWVTVCGGLAIICGLSAILMALLTAHSSVYPQPPRSGMARLMTPWRENVEAALPGANVDLNAVLFVPGTSTVYVGGNGGLLLRSDDFGWTWNSPIKLPDVPTPTLAPAGNANNAAGSPSKSAPAITVPPPFRNSVTPSLRNPQATPAQKAPLKGAKKSDLRQPSHPFFSLIPAAYADTLAEDPASDKSKAPNKNSPAQNAAQQTPPNAQQQYPVQQQQTPAQSNTLDPRQQQAVPSSPTDLKSQTSQSNAAPNSSQRQDDNLISSVNAAAQDGRVNVRVTFSREVVYSGSGATILSRATGKQIAVRASQSTGVFAGIATYETTADPFARFQVCFPNVILITKETKSACQEVTLSSTDIAALRTGLQQPVTNAANQSTQTPAQTTATNIPPANQSAPKGTPAGDIILIGYDSAQKLIWAADVNHALFFRSMAASDAAQEQWSAVSLSSPVNSRLLDISRDPLLSRAMSQRTTFPLSDAKSFCADFYDSATPSAAVHKMPDGTLAFAPTVAGAFRPTACGPIRAEALAVDKLHGVRVGPKGMIEATADCGNQWMRVLRDSSQTPNGSPRNGLPLAVYLLTLMSVGFGTAYAVGLKREPPVVVQERIKPVAVSDRPLEPGEPDANDLNGLATGLSRFLRNTETLPPLTIAIEGEWGSGKSSIMNLLRADLVSRGFHPVWFNAWHHQKEEHLLAALLQAVRLESVPAWWKPSGVPFRARLIWAKAKRHWLAFLVTVGVVVFVWSLTPELHTFLSSILRHLTLPGERHSLLDDFGDKGKYIGPVLVTLGSAFGLLSKFSTAFGVKPAELMASISRGAKVADLDAQTSFRQKFSREFADVTRALGQRSMTIFIDDLDRCRPENVRDVLEAINFVVSSGECFVILGIARAPVQAAVGLSFKDIAAELTLTNGVKDDDGKEHRRQFAQNYLAKIFNIEVKVPKTGAAQAKSIIMPTKVQELPGARALRWTRMALAYSSVVVLGTLIVIAGLRLGDHADARLHDWNKAHQETDAARQGGNTAPSPQTGAGTTATSGTSASVTPAPNLKDSTSTTSELAPLRPAVSTTFQFQPAKRLEFAGAVASLPLLTLLFVVLGGAYVFVTRESVTVEDSNDFKQAVDDWSQVVLARDGTPRSLKRFINWVRYLDMIQTVDGRTRLERRAASVADWFTNHHRDTIAAWLKRNFTAEGLPAARHVIPADRLVGLAALSFLDPQLLACCDDPMKLQSYLSASPVAQLAALPSDALARFSTPDGIVDLERFRELIADVTVSGVRVSSANLGATAA